MTIWKCFLSICWQRSKNREAEESVPASEAAAAGDVEADIEAKALAGIEAFRAQLAGMQDDTPAMPTATKESSTDHSDPAKNDADISEHAASAQNNRPPTTRGGTDS